ncbi:tetratricopeptide repeat-containing sensor histidine kinase [Tenacibaculum sp.]|uniref:tetratricopeptide repeat-containing sensor histidine kinase n=1 Tax=Tenacibaculum sp. TaxID=1906242 RepID=UPI003D0C569C
MKRKDCIIFIIISFFCLQVFSFQIESSKRLAKVQKKIDQLKENSEISEELFKAYDEISYLYNKKKDYYRAIDYAGEMLEVARELGKEKLIAEAYSKLGFYKRKEFKNEEAFKFYQLSLVYYLKDKNLNRQDSLNLGKTYRNIAQIQSFYGDYLSSEKNNVNALLYINDRDKNLKARIYYSIGVDYKKRKLFKEALERYDLAINLSNFSKDRAKYYNAKANVYRYLKEYNKSINIFNHLLDTVDYEKNIKSKARVIDNLAYTKWLQDSTRNVLSDLHLAESIRVAEKDRNGLKASYAHLVDYYKNINGNRALTYAYKMQDVAKKEKSPYDVIEALDKIKILEKPEKAILIANRRSILKDSLELAKDREQGKYALIKYESEENEKKAIENRLLAEQQRSQKQLWIFAAILTIVTSIIYFFYRREKTKKEKAIEVYNTETRLAKKIHDELANDVYAVMSTLQNNSITDSNLLTRVEKIYAQTRDISHENSPVLTGEYFENFLKQLFVDFTNDTCKVIHKGLLEVNINELPKEKQIVVYRVLQELLVNMKKYSKANLVLISFSIQKHTLSVMYQDNGIGTENLAMKNGLQNMETRIKSVGGFITFESKQGKGFQAKFQFKK